MWGEIPDSQPSTSKAPPKSVPKKTEDETPKDVTLNEIAKKEEELNLLQCNPVRFLQTFGGSLTQRQLSYFEKRQHENAEIAKNLKTLKSRIRNRRLMAMSEMLKDGGDFFTVTSMRSREPKLFHRLLGRFENRLVEDDRSLSSLILENVDLDREKLEIGDDREFDDLDEDEAKKEFVRLMRERFLDGGDENFFDYSKVDLNEDFDDLEMSERDAQDAYFDED